MWTSLKFEVHNNIQLNKKVDFVMGMITRVINAKKWRIERLN